MSDDDTFLRYDLMVENALRGVVETALNEVKDDGMLGDHRFYITFYTQHPDVQIPDYLRESYPEEMTIVLQYQFYDLEVTKEKLSVTLSFNNVPEQIVVPLEAISIFADPSVNFALQFQPLGKDDTFEFEEELLSVIEDDDVAPKKEKPKKSKSKAKDSDDKKGDDDEENSVVSLDVFRKKKEKDDN